MDNYKISAIQCREAMHQASPWLHHLSNGCAGLAAHSCGFPPLVGCIISSILPSAVSTAVAACREYAGSMQGVCREYAGSMQGVQGICREYAGPGHSCQVHSVLSNRILHLKIAQWRHFKELNF